MKLLGYFCGDRLHLSLVGEWQGYRWRPVLPWEKVSYLVDEEGFLYRYPDELWARKPKIEEIEAEFRAQVNLAMKKGVTIQYLDIHYTGFAEYPGLEDVNGRIAKDYDFPVFGRMVEKLVRGVYKVPVAEKKLRAMEMR
jgi:chitin disaccharide deacetylase